MLSGSRSEDLRLFAPDGGEPGLEVAWFSGRAVVVLQFDELSLNHEAPVGGEIQEAGVAIPRPAFFIGAMGIGSE